MRGDQSSCLFFDDQANVGLSTEWLWQRRLRRADGIQALLSYTDNLRQKKNKQNKSDPKYAVQERNIHPPVARLNPLLILRALLLHGPIARVVRLRPAADLG